MAMTKVSLSQAQSFIMAICKEMADTKKCGEAVMLHSSPGVGKSAVIHQIGADIKDLFEQAFDAKFKIWDVRVGAQQESDIQGIPYPATVDVIDGIEIKDMLFSTPQWFPRDGECGILLLDELANAPTPNQHACYRLVHDRTIHNGTKLPEGVIVLAAGNLKEDKTGAKGILPALARRFCAHFLVEPTAEDFITYAMKRKLHPAVAGWVNFKPSDLVSKALDGEYGFACPANYESVSRILLNRYLTPAEKETGVLSCLGSSVGSNFIGFLRNERWLPNYEEVQKTGVYNAPNDANADRGIMFIIISTTAMRMVDMMEADNPDYEAIDNLNAIFKEFDVSSAGVAFRSIKRANPKALMQIMTNSKLSKLRDSLKKVLDRTSAMASE